MAEKKQLYIGFNPTKENLERVEYIMKETGLPGKSAVMNWAIKLAYDAVRRDSLSQ